MKLKQPFTKKYLPILVMVILLSTQAPHIQAAGTGETPDASLETSSFAAGGDLTSSSANIQTTPPLTLPEQADWKNAGVAIQAGAAGSWDQILWGGFANNLVKKGNTYFLYYQGSRYYDETCQSVAYRSIGVATSTDGITWKKYTGNPVITWASQGSVEEGAASSAAWVGADGSIYLYYGANSGTGCNVQADGRLAKSTDGFTFVDQGRVISGLSSSIWGYGDEIFPIGAYEYQGAWNVFYTPNGVTQARKLGVVSGSSPTSLTSSAGVNGGTVPAWGTVSTIMNGSSSVLFVNDGGTDQPLKAYRFNPADPKNITLAKTYIFSDCARFSVLYDSSLARWLLLCTDKPNYTGYQIKIANVAAAAPAPTATAPAPTATRTAAPLPSPTATRTSAPLLPAPTATATRAPAPLPSPTATPGNPQVAVSGALAGKITAPDGSVVPGVRITIRNSSTKKWTTSNAAGDYIIPDLPPGEYRIRFQASGFNQYITPITIQPGITTTLDVRLTR